MKGTCPINYDINNCSSKEYGLDCATCNYWDNNSIMTKINMCIVTTIHNEFNKYQAINRLMAKYIILNEEFSKKLFNEHIKFDEARLFGVKLLIDKTLDEDFIIVG